MLAVVSASADRDNTADPATSTSLIDEIVREGARFRNGKLVERPDEDEAA